MPAYQTDLDKKPRGFLQALRSAIKAFRESKGFFSKIRSAFSSLFRSPPKYQEYKMPQMPPSVTMPLPIKPETKTPNVYNENKVQNRQTEKISSIDKVRDAVLGMQQNTVLTFAKAQAEINQTKFKASTQVELKEPMSPSVPTKNSINVTELPDPEKERDILNLKCEDLITKIGLEKARHFSHPLVRGKFDIDAKPALTAIDKIQQLIKTEKNPDELVKKVNGLINDLAEKKAPKDDTAGQHRRDNYLNAIKDLAGEIKSTVKPEITTKAKM